MCMCVCVCVGLCQCGICCSWVMRYGPNGGWQFDAALSVKKKNEKKKKKIKMNRFLPSVTADSGVRKIPFMTCAVTFLFWESKG